MSNDLSMGTHRTGDFYDSYQDTPEVKVTLARSEQGIGVTVAWSTPEVPYASWFLRGGGFLAGDEPGGLRPVPRRVVFYDSHGSILLIRCWARGYHANALGPGSGTLWARAAIMGVHADIEFDRPHGLSTEISGLREWLGVTSWDEDYGDVNGLTIASLKSLPSSKTDLGEYAGATLHLSSAWQVIPEQGGDRRVLLDLMRCTTRSAEPMDWDTHLQLHKAIRDLLVVSRWRNASRVVVLAMRADDPITTMEGAEHGEQWRDVVVPEDERTPQPVGWFPHLLRYTDLGPVGVSRWIELRDRFARALDPVIPASTSEMQLPTRAWLTLGLVWRHWGTCSCCATEPPSPQRPKHL